MVQATRTMGKCTSSYFRVLIINLRQTDGNILSYRKLGWFFFNTGVPGQRSLLQRIVGFCHVVKTYTAIPNILMILFVPWISWPVVSATSTASASQEQQMLRLYLVLLMATILHKFCYIRMHGGIGIQAAKNQQANRFWNTPRNSFPGSHIALPP